MYRLFYFSSQIIRIAPWEGERGKALQNRKDKGKANNAALLGVNCQARPQGPRPQPWLGPQSPASLRG